jgi:hypothetical protein
LSQTSETTDNSLEDYTTDRKSQHTDTGRTNIKTSECTDDHHSLLAVAVALEKPNSRMVMSSETTALKQKITEQRSNKHPNLKWSET